MIEAIDHRALVDEYTGWLGSQMDVAVSDGRVVVTTPFLDRHNDQLQIAMVATDGGFRLTDGGYVLADLAASGWEPSSERRRDLLATVLNGLGVNEENGELVAVASRDNLPQREHDLIQAMLAVNDLYVTARGHVTSLFSEDVEDYLRSGNVRFGKAYKVAGRSGLDHPIDFAIPPSPAQPERLLRVIPRPTRSSVQLVTFAFNDIADARPEAARIAVVNDSGGDVSEQLIRVMRNWGIEVLKWSERNERIERLAA